MIRPRSLKRAAGFAALLLVGSFRAHGEELDERADPAPTPYREFKASGRGAILLAIARRAYLDAAGAQAMSPLDLPESEDRPAGPRDEPPPPEWPAGPTGLVLCLRLNDEIRACEGGRLPASEDLATAITDLAERLPLSRSRGKPKILKPAQQSRATLEAAFVTEVQAPRRDTGGGGRKKARLPDGVEQTSVGFVVSGAGGELVTLPGEARSLGAALRIARRAGITARAEGGPNLWWYRPENIGSLPVVSP